MNMSSYYLFVSNEKNDVLNVTRMSCLRSSEAIV